MGGSTDTIDTLIEKLGSGQLDDRLPVQHVDLSQRNRIRSLHQRSAAVSVAASFLAKEWRARELGFERYRDFLRNLFPGAHANWPPHHALDPVHVLTFNYDRLFEIAFLDRFNISGYSLYGARGLNSGLNAVNRSMHFDSTSFSFVKLHGSIGMWAIDILGRGTGPFEFVSEGLTAEPLQISDQFFFRNPTNANPDALKAQPLLVFPSDRQFIVENESGFAYHEYVRAVWARAIKVLSEAKDIHVIGYSFSGIDRGPFLDLLGHASLCERIVVRNPNATEICDHLLLDRPHLKQLLHAHNYAF